MWAGGGWGGQGSRLGGLAHESGHGGVVAAAAGGLVLGAEPATGARRQ